MQKSHAAFVLASKMQVPAWFRPKENLTPDEIDTGLRVLVYDAMCSFMMSALAGGAFLTAFALILGASNKFIGLMAAVFPFCQVLQIPSILLVEKLRLRKMIAILGVFHARICYIVLGLLPWIAPTEWRLPMLLGLLALYHSLTAIAVCSWNSWLRDLIPERIMASYFGQRLAWGTALAAGIGLAAGVAVDMRGRIGLSDTTIYSVLICLGGMVGMTGAIVLLRVPEPKIQHAMGYDLRQLLAEPFRNRAFRRVLVFLASWNFAVNMALPFFTVYLLKNMHLKIGIVMGLTVLTQLTNIVCFKPWGHLADRLSERSILSIAGPIFLLSLALWPCAMMPPWLAGQLAILAVIHVLAGIAMSGSTVASYSLALKSAPREKATAYLATNSLVMGLGGCSAPVIAGFVSDWLEPEQLAALMPRFFEGGRLMGGVGMAREGGINSLDVVFAMAIMAGIFALQRLVKVGQESRLGRGLEFAELLQMPAFFLRRRELDLTREGEE